MNALDDIATFAELAQCRLGVLRDCPLPGADLIGESKRLQLAEAANLHRMEFVRLLLGARRKIPHAGAIAFPGKLAVEMGPVPALELPFSLVPDLGGVSGASVSGDE